MRFFAFILYLIATFACIGGLMTQFTLFFQTSLTALIAAMGINWALDAEEKDQ